MGERSHLVVVGGHLEVHGEVVLVTQNGDAIKIANSGVLTPFRAARVPLP